MIKQYMQVELLPAFQNRFCRLQPQISKKVLEYRLQKSANPDLSEPGWETPL